MKRKRDKKDEATSCLDETSFLGKERKLTSLKTNNTTMDCTADRKMQKASNGFG
jgi:hypothetical protein